MADFDAYTCPYPDCGEIVSGETVVDPGFLDRMNEHKAEHESAREGIALHTAKEIEVGERMREVLTAHGFTRQSTGEWQEVWRKARPSTVRDPALYQYGESNMKKHFTRVVISRVTDIHDPVEAEVLDTRFKRDVALAYNSKGLDILLNREPE